MKNKIIVDFWVPKGHDPKEEVETSWRPINFSIYSDLFQDMINEAITDWLADNDLNIEQHTEVIFEHVTEFDGAGAVMGEWFLSIHVERSQL